MSGAAGTRITMWMGEDINPDGTVNQISTGGPIYDGYTFAGRASETYRPKFMYHGFQYLMVNLTNAPLASDMKAFAIRADNEAVGSIKTSSTLFDNIYKITDRAVVSNMYSVMTDCPCREKLGWLEEPHLVFDTIALGYDMHAYSKDMARTISEAQTSSGLVPSIAPEFFINVAGWGGDPTAMRDDPNWGSALVLVPLKTYQHYGDLDMLEQYYPAMQSYLNYRGSRASGYLLNYGLGDWSDLTLTTPVGLTATFGYQQATAGTLVIASALGKTDDAQTYATLNTNIQQAFHAKYFNSSSNSYATGSQGCTAAALDMGAVPESLQPAVISHLVESFVSNGYHPTFGEVLLPSVFRALNAAGRDDVLFNMMNLTTAPSYGYILESGATSLWEGWDAIKGGDSLNHWMMGYASTWLVGLSGISQQNTSVAWQKLQLKPLVVGDLSSASASHRTPYGVVSSAWTKNGTAINYDVNVPVSSTAQVYLSGSLITESGSSLQVGSNGIFSLEKPSNSSAIIGIDSGSYHFVSS
jgi:alpha-L-rhamnosidase